MKDKMPYRKILIVGCGGAGKSTLAVEMGKKFSLPVVHLDKLWWLPDWKNRPKEEFDVLLEAELKKDAWIMDGNFVRTFATRLNRADFCVFLDYPQKLCIKSVKRRVEQYRGTTRPDMTEGCIERMDPEFEEWIISYRQSVRPRIMEILERANLPYRIFCSRRETAEWLNGFDA